MGGKKREVRELRKKTNGVETMQTVHVQNRLVVLVHVVLHSMHTSVCGNAVAVVAADILPS